MEISYLREFVELAQTCQFHETAEKLFISQSTLSKHIKIIEAELGAQLFIRSTRRVELTETGRAFLAYASQIAMLQQDYTQELIKTDITKVIRVAADSIISMRQIEKYFALYLTDHPNVSFEMAEYDKTTLRSMLRSGELDLIVACRDLIDTDSDFGFHPYYTDRLSVVISPHNPLYDRESVTISDLKGHTFAQSGSLNFAQYIDPSIPAAQYKSKRNSFITHLLNVTPTVAVVPTNAGYFMTTNDISQNLKMIPIQPEVLIHVDFMYMKARENTPFLQTIFEKIDGDMEELSHQPGFCVEELDPLMI